MAQPPAGRPVCQNEVANDCFKRQSSRMPRLKRVNYSTGQLLNAADFQAEQEYHRAKLRRHNLLFHGWGIVTGLEVSVTKDARRWSVVVTPGYAVDKAGNDIDLSEVAKLPMPDAASTLLVELRYAETLTDFVPVISDGDGEQSQPSRVEEGGEVVLVTQSDSASSKTPRASLNLNPNVVLARLIATKRGWRIDRRHKAMRTR